MKFCPNCGKEINSRFCPYCGFDTGNVAPGNNANYNTYYMPPEKQKESVTEKTWFIILLLLVFWPLGLFFMWKANKFSKTARIIITAVIGILFVLSLTLTIIGLTAADDYDDYYYDDSYDYSYDYDDYDDSDDYSYDYDSDDSFDNDTSGGGSINEESETESYTTDWCSACGGDGNCNNCGGDGSVERLQAGTTEWVTQTCTSCVGSGNCWQCGGSGKN